MKKIGALLAMLLVCLLCIHQNSYAVTGRTYKTDKTNKTYHLADLGLNITIPSDYVVFFRNVKADDPNLATYGLTKSDLLSVMKNGNIYLDMWDKDVTFEIMVTMVESPLSDFSSISDTLLSAITSAMEPEYENIGITLDSYEIYYHNQTKFIKIYQSAKQGNDTVYGVQYYTVCHEKAINVTMTSYSGKIDDSKEKVIESIVDTVKFDKEPEKPKATKTTPAFLYTDPDTKCQFTVPANWSQEEFSSDKQFLDAKFASNIEDGLLIMYGSSDIWNEMSSSDKKGHSRSNIDNEYFSTSDIAQMLGVYSSRVSDTSFDGKGYYKVVNKYSSSEYGVTFKSTMTSFIRFENGYLYMFQFWGDSTNPYYKDFEALLKSVKYPSNSSMLSSTKGINSFDTDASALIFSILITILVYSLPIIVYRFAILKHPIDGIKAGRITVIYGVIALMIMASVMYALNGNATAPGGAILFYSWINYLVLRAGDNRAKDKNNSDNESNETPAESYTSKERIAVDPPEVVEPIQENESEYLKLERMTAELFKATESDKDEASNTSSSKNLENEAEKNLDFVFCYKCGTKQPITNKFCHECGAKIVKGD
ncbi:hypothetical protein SAMN02910339_00804 [Lachnospiraceae bacterium YSD2013]|nr:hypothetical protein SAMN02910339_00804 [Lachnospiraceae bacterium YSD2013]